LYEDIHFYKNFYTESGVTPTKTKSRKAITWVMVFLLAITSMYMAPDTANAEIEMKDGVFRYSTKVTLAAGSIRYMTVGWQWTSVNRLDTWNRENYAT